MQENTIVKPAGGQTPPSKPSRWRLSLLLTILFLCVVASLYYNIPQQYLLPRVAGAFLGADISVTVQSLRHRANLSNLEVRQPNEPQLPPFLCIKTIDMPWSLRGPKHIPRLNMGEVQIDIDDSGTSSNFQWLRDYLSKPSSGRDMAPFIPETFSAGPISLRAQLPGMQIRLGDLDMIGDARSLYDARMKVTTPKTSLTWSSDALGNGKMDLAELALSFAATRDDVQANISADMDQMGRFHLNARRDNHSVGGPSRWTCTARKTFLQGPFWGDLLSRITAVPVKFDGVVLDTAAAAFVRDATGIHLDGTPHLNGSVKALLLGPSESPWFAGDFFVEEKSGNHEIHLTGKERPPVFLACVPLDGAWSVKMDTGVWEKDKAAMLLPPAWRELFLGRAWFNTVESAVRIRPDKDGWEVSGRFAVDVPPVENGKTALEVTVSRKAGSLGGTAVFSSGPDTNMALKQISFDSGRSSAILSGSADLAQLAKAFHVYDLWGAVKVEGKLQREASGQIAADPLNIVFETLGYGNYGIPYGQPLTVSMPFHYGPEQGLETGAVTAKLSEDTVLNMASVAWKAGAVEVRDVVLETGLAPMVAKGWLSAAEGKATLKSPSFRWAETGSESSFEYDAVFPRLDLPGGMGSLKNLTAGGQLNYEGGFSGNGEVSAEEISISGAILHNPKGIMQGDGADLVMENLAFGLFAGAVNGEIRIKPLETALPMSFSAKLENIDLDVFTKEYKPPSTTLTGLVSGTVAATFDWNGLRALDVNLSAANGFSMNRDLVEKLLAQQYLSGVTGGKQIEDVLRDVVGQSPQIPFGRAALTLGFEDGRITGSARMESPKLNLTLDIKADPGAIMEALRARSGGAGVEKSAQ